jgi:hypothetical protein
MREDDPPVDNWGSHPWHLYVGTLDDLSNRFPEAVRHLAMRAQFVQCMVEDPRIEQTVRHVRRQKLDAAATTLLERLANAENLDCDAERAFLRASENESFCREYDLWSRRLIRATRVALEAFDTPRLAGGVRWPWLLQDVSTWYAHAYLDEMLMGRSDTDLKYVLEPARRRVAAEQRPGESAREFFARIKTEAAPGPSRRRAPGKKLERQAQYAVWFYRYHILGETLDQLAREYHDAEHLASGRRHGRTVSSRGLVRKDRCDDRPAVEYGIRQAERYLDHFPSLGAWCVGK